MSALKHLPFGDWPVEDQTAWQAAFVAGDIFDGDGGPGAHFSPGSRKSIQTAYRRWLGFLKESHPETLAMSPADRMTPGIVRDYIEALATSVSASTVAIYATHLSYAARLIAPDRDWDWLRATASRLQARAGNSDRFDRLVPPWRILDHGIAMMDEALTGKPRPSRGNDVAYRDGLLLALLALWPIRRRSLAALTVSRHVERHGERIVLLLHPEDTKARRAESFDVPDVLLPHVARYLDRVRPTLLGIENSDAFWISACGNAMCAGQLFQRVYKKTRQAFGHAMGLHDFRRAAATYIAMDAPDLIGIVPGALQHLSPDVSEQHYNLARTTQASRRHGAHLASLRDDLRGAWRRQK